MYRLRRRKNRMTHAHTQEQDQGTTQGTALTQEQDRSLPVEIQRLIYEFARPLTRPDWKRCRGSVAGLIRRMNQTTVFHFYMPMDFTLPELSLYDRLCFLGRLKERTYA